jgi:hypothetical protein
MLKIGVLAPGNRSGVEAIPKEHASSGTLVQRKKLVLSTKTPKVWRCIPQPSPAPIHRTLAL